MPNLHTLILANLTAHEMKLFHEAHVTYSGSTGAAATSKSHGTLAPYIATYVSELQAATIAMKWHHFGIVVNEEEWVARKAKVKTVIEL